MSIVVTTATRLVGVAILAVLTSCSAATSGRPIPADLQASAQSYIVEAQSTDAAAKAVRDAGGRVTSRLGVIDAVEADLTDAQHALVLRAAGIKQITTNSLVMTNAAASVLDRFETGSFANNDGSHRWYGEWVETNDNASPYNGKVTIGWPDRGGNRMIVGQDGAVYRRAATPSSSATVTLKFNYARFGFEASDFLSVQASGN